MIMVWNISLGKRVKYGSYLILFWLSGGVFMVGFPSIRLYPVKSGQCLNLYAMVFCFTVARFMILNETQSQIIVDKISGL